MSPGEHPVIGRKDSGRGQRGSAAVWGTLILGLLVVLTVVVTVLAGAVADRRRVSSAADLAALAGAAAGQRGEDACAAAGATARRNDARLTSCAAVGPTVTVGTARVAGPVLGLRFVVRATARAGPVGPGGTPAMAGTGSRGVGLRG